MRNSGPLFAALVGMALMPPEALQARYVNEAPTEPGQPYDETPKSRQVRRAEARRDAKYSRNLHNRKGRR